jgi:hypothetical protein
VDPVGWGWLPNEQIDSKVNNNKINININNKTVGKNERRLPSLENEKR